MPHDRLAAVQLDVPAGRRVAAEGVAIELVRLGQGEVAHHHAHALLVGRVAEREARRDELSDRELGRLERAEQAG
ncbi:hypothetical protein D3C78_1679480 [compost metagenome]